MANMSQELTYQGGNSLYKYNKSKKFRKIFRISNAWIGKGIEWNIKPQMHICRTTVHGNNHVLNAEQIQVPCNKHIQKGKRTALHPSNCLLADWPTESTEKHNTYQLLHIYPIPPDYGLQICLKHVDVDWRNKLRINSASSWFSLHRCIVMQCQQNIKITEVNTHR